MDLSRSFLEEIKKKLIKSDADEIEMIYEDYSYVSHLALQLGFQTGRADVWCSNCEMEFEEVEFNTTTFEWKCPRCGKISNQ